MENETQNQDTQAAPQQQQQPVVEEAQAAPQQAMDATQAATSEVVHDDPPGVPQQEEQQEQQQEGIAVGEPDLGSPSGEPLSEEALGIGIDDISAEPSASDLFGNDFLSDVSEYDDWIEEMPNLEYTTENTSGYIEQQEQKYWDLWDSEHSAAEAGSMPIDKIVDPAPTDQGQELPGASGEQDGDATTAGGYDGSGIAGGLDLDGMPDNTGINPHVQPDFPGNDPVDQHEANVTPDEAETDPDASEGEGYTYDEGAYEDAEDAFEDLQDALQDGDEEDLAEALEELQGYLGGFDKGATEDENPDLTGADPEEAKDATGGDPADGNAEEDPKDRGEGVMEDDGEGGTNPADVDYQEVLDDLDSGNLDEVREFLEGLAGGEEEEEAKDAPVGGHEHGHFANEGISVGDIVGEKDEDAYDEGAYEDAEDAMKDLGHALKHGDEEDRAEALQKLQGYVGGFDKGAAEDEAPGLTGGDTEELPNTVDKEVADAPDASGAAVSGAAVGAAGAAAGAGAVGEAGGLDEDLVKEAQDVFGDMFGVDEAADGWGEVAGGAVEAAGGVGEAAGGAGDTVENIANGNFDGALNGATQQAGGAIDGALGIEGSGKVLDQVANGNIEEAYDGVVDYGADKAGDWIGEQLGSEELGDTASEVFNHVANGDFEEALDTAVEGIGDAAEDLWDSIWD